MKIALVQCPSWTVESPPYALGLIAAELRDQGFEVEGYDFNVDAFSYCHNVAETVSTSSSITSASWRMDAVGAIWYDHDRVSEFVERHQMFIETLIARLVQTDARIIGFSAQSISSHFSLYLAKRVKALAPSKIIVFGGPLCFRNCSGIDLLTKAPWIDAICFGEAEEHFAAFLRDYQQYGALRARPGFAVRKPDGTIVDGGDPTASFDLNKLPFADYSIFEGKQYTKKIIPIMTSRGCPNRCAFCSESPQWRKYRVRTTESVIAEIRHQLQVFPQARELWLNDSLINGNLRFLDEFCQRMTTENFRFTWGGQAMIRKEMTDDLLKRMYAAGCRLISYGVEGGNEHILQLMNKNWYAPSLAMDVMMRTYRAGIGVIFNVIVGFPGETEEDFEETKRFVAQAKPYAQHIEICPMMLLKGSRVQDKYQEYGIVNPSSQFDWRTSDGCNTPEIRERRIRAMRELVAAK